MFFQGNSIDYKRSAQLRQIRPNSTNMIFVVHIWAGQIWLSGLSQCRTETRWQILDYRSLNLIFFVLAPLDQEYALAALKKID